MSLLTRRGAGPRVGVLQEAGAETVSDVTGGAGLLGAVALGQGGA